MKHRMNTWDHSEGKGPASVELDDAKGGVSNLYEITFDPHSVSLNGSLLPIAINIIDLERNEIMLSVNDYMGRPVHAITETDGDTTTHVSIEGKKIATILEGSRDFFLIEEGKHVPKGKFPESTKIVLAAIATWKYLIKNKRIRPHLAGI